MLYAPVLSLIKGNSLVQQALGGRLLHTAVKYDARRASEFLLDRDVPVDYENHEGETPLHVACRAFEGETLLEVLLQRKADGNRLSPKTGFSPYHIAVQHHCPTVVSILARHGADINLYDRNHRTPLVYAALNGYGIEIMEILIQHGAYFRFWGLRTRDELAPHLAEWVYRFSPDDVPLLVDRLLVAGCVQQERPRSVVSALLWSKHTEDALLFLFLVLFTAPSKCRKQAYTMIAEWLECVNATLVVKKLLRDALQR